MLVNLVHGHCVRSDSSGHWAVAGASTERTIPQTQPVPLPIW
jgi:hypothetical protein